MSDPLIGEHLRQKVKLGSRKGGKAGQGAKEVGRMPSFLHHSLHSIIPIIVQTEKSPFKKTASPTGTAAGLWGGGIAWEGVPS